MYRDTNGSLTVEAMILLPLVFLLIAILLRWGLLLLEDLQDTARDRDVSRHVELIGRDNSHTWENEGDTWFLYGGPPARRIRDADTLIDLGLSVVGKLPQWFQ